MMEQQHPAWILVALFVLYSLVRAVQHRVQIVLFKRKHSCEDAKGLPQRDRILGLDTFWRLKQHSQKRIALQENYKSALTGQQTYTASILGQRFISSCDPENIKAALTTNFNDWGIGPRINIFGPLLGRGIFTSDDAAWEHSRALIRPSFTRAQVADLSYTEIHVQKLMDRIPRDGHTVDLQPLLFNFTLDNATDFLFGRSVNCQSDPAMDHFSTAFDYAEHGIGPRIRLGKLAFLARDARFDEACRAVHDFVDGYIKDCLSPDNGKSYVPRRYNLLNELASVCADRVQLRDELLNILLAARDTTAGLLSSTMYFLARHPVAWRCIQAEVAGLDGKIPSYEDVKSLHYVRNVVNEALRLHPPVPSNVRFARRHTVLPRGGGPDGQSPIFVAKGTALYYTVWTMHRLPEVYGNDAEDFRPERWFADEKPLRPGWAYLPFNGGPRICLGQQSGLMEASYTVIRLVQSFDRIEPRGGVFVENVGLTMSNYNGTKVALWRRSSAGRH